jgi:DNA mismatch repair protein MSH2
VDRLTRKLEQQKATLSDLCQLYRASCRLPLIEAALRNYAGDQAELLVEK